MMTNLLLELVYRLGQLYGHGRSCLGHVKRIIEILRLLTEDDMGTPDL